MKIVQAEHLQQGGETEGGYFKQTNVFCLLYILKMLIKHNLFKINH